MQNHLNPELGLLQPKELPTAIAPVLHASADGYVVMNLSALTLVTYCVKSLIISLIPPKSRDIYDSAGL